MPKKVEKALFKKAREMHLIGEDADRFVYGTMRHKLGWKPKREK